MKGIAEDETTVLWTKLIGIMTTKVYGTVGNTADFIIDDPTCVAPYLQFELTGLTGITKQTVAGTITIDYFSKVEYQNKVGQTQPATLPIIVGNLGNVRTNGAGQNKYPSANLVGSFDGTKAKSNGGDQSGEGRWAGWYDRVTFDASRCSDIYSGTYNRPESLATQYIIKWR